MSPAYKLARKLFQFFLLYLHKDENNIPTTASVSRSGSARLSTKGLRSKLCCEMLSTRHGEIYGGVTRQMARHVPASFSLQASYTTLTKLYRRELGLVFRKCRNLEKRPAHQRTDDVESSQGRIRRAALQKALLLSFILLRLLGSLGLLKDSKHIVCKSFVKLWSMVMQNINVKNIFLLHSNCKLE